MFLDDAINFLIVACFSAAFFALLAIATHLVEDILPRHTRKIQDYFRDLDDAINFLIAVCFSAAFFAFLAIVIHLST